MKKGITMKKRILVFLLVVFVPYHIFAQFGNAIYLNGSGQIVEVPDDTSYDALYLDALTVEIRFKPSNWNHANVIGKYYLEEGWCIDINQVNGALHFWIGPPGGGGTIDMGVDSWTYYSFVLDFNFHPTTRKQEYVNGQLILSGPTSENKDAVSSVGHSLWMGGRTDGRHNYMKGMIDEVRIWNIARSESQIQATFNDSLGPEYYLTPDSGLVAYYRFEKMENLGVGDDGFEDDIRDLSTCGNHADLVGHPVLLPFETPVSVEERISVIPTDYALLQSYPNPFNASTILNFNLPEPGFVTLRVFDVLGREIETVTEKDYPAGAFTVQWNAADIPSGMYIVRMQVNGFEAMDKLILQR